jgi:hypothetical protein
VDDVGQVDGGFEVALDRFLPVGNSASPPTAFLPTDVVALLDPSTFEIVITRVGPKVLP